MKNRTLSNRFTVVAVALALVSAAGVASAHGNKGERFKRADKNGDGFITQDEVSPKRWERIQVADANKDGKISLDELQQAYKDGKIKKRGWERKHKDKDKSA